MRLFRTGHDEIMMLVVTGRERTASEFAELMAAAGWRYDAWHRVPNAFHHATTAKLPALALARVTSWPSSSLRISRSAARLSRRR